MSAELDKAEDSRKIALLTKNGLRKELAKVISEINETRIQIEQFFSHSSQSVDKEQMEKEALKAYYRDGGCCAGCTLF